MADDSSFVRQWKIFKAILTSSAGMTVKEMAEKFDVSTKTIRRDMELLQSVMVPFECVNESHGEKRYTIETMMLNFALSLNRDELLAFYVGRKLMMPLRGTYFWEGVESGCEKIKRVLSRSTVEYADSVAPFFFQFEYGKADYRTKGELIDSLLRGMEESRVVRICYRSMASKQSKSYEIRPYNFVYNQGFIYVIGFSCKDGEIRIWKANRMASAQVTGERFERPKDFDVTKFMAHTLYPFVGHQKAVTAKIRFTPEVARIVLEQELKTVKNVKFSRDGSATVEMEVEPDTPFLRWVLGFGDGAEVVSPQKMREQLKNEIRRLVKMYEDGRN